jgi:hypothetical protein
MEMSAAHPDRRRLETDHHRRADGSPSSHRRTHAFDRPRRMLHLHPAKLGGVVAGVSPVDEDIVLHAQLAAVEARAGALDDKPAT